MKSNAIARIIIFSIVLLLLSVVLLIGLALGAFSFNHSTQIYALTESVLDPLSVEQIEIQWVAGDIHIRCEDVQEISFYEERTESAKSLAWNLNGGVLTIEYQESAWTLRSLRQQEKNLFVVVPIDWYCSHLDIETVSGDIDFVGTLDRFSCEGVSARCDLTLSGKATNIETDCISGDLYLHLPAGFGFEVNLDSMSGSLKSAYDTNYRDGSYTYGDASCKIAAQTVSGSVYIKKSD